MSYLKVERTELLELLRDKRVFVTGGTGSFGSTFVELCLSSAAVASVTVFSRDEQKHVALRRRFPDKRLRTMLGDVRDLERLRFTMRGADLVFNAAAIKHVHFTEAHPMEAVNTNIIGAFNVCQVAAEVGVEAVVDLSTDKAVEPVNAMGMTKALQERIVTSFAGGRTRFGVVRYGNVLASNGSVVPYFKRLLEEGSDRLPITDRRMTRFVLTLADSVDLVLYAMRECRNGEIYVLDLPAFLIADVAEVMAERARSGGRKVQIEEIGVRPGEKLHETLISPEEMRHATQTDGFWCIRPFASSEELFPAGTSERRLSSDTATRMEKQQIAELLESQNCFPRLLPVVRSLGSIA